MSLLHSGTKQKPPVIGSDSAAGDASGRPPIPSNARSRRLWLMATVTSVIALLAGIAFVGWTASNRPHAAAPASQPSGQMLASGGSYPVPAFALQDQNGALVTPATLHGHVTLIAFLDPTCTTLCPTLGRQLASIETSLAPAQRPNIVIVSVAPNRTPAQAAEFASTAGFTPGWRFLLGPAQGLAPTWKAFHVTVIPSTGDVLHDGAVAVVDKTGQVRDELYAPFPSSLLTTEVKAFAAQ